MARILNCTKLTITRLIPRYRVTGRTADTPRSRRPRVTIANEDRHLRILHLRNRFLTVTSSAATGLEHVISRHTVRRRLRQHDIRAYRPFRGMTLTMQYRLRRLRWARQLQRWQHQNGQRVLFSDESRFQLFRAYGRRENSSVLCSGDGTVWFGSVIVWSGFC